MPHFLISRAFVSKKKFVTLFITKILFFLIFTPEENRTRTKIKSFSYARRISFRDLLYSIVSIANYIVLFTLKYVKKIYLMLCSYQQNTHTQGSFWKWWICLTPCGDGITGTYTCPNLPWYIKCVQRLDLWGWMHGRPHRVR